MTGPASAAQRLALYRRAARALNRFCGRWVASFCVCCLEVTRRYHRGDPRAVVDLVEGVFPGCCHSGAGDVLWVPGFREKGQFSPGMMRAMERARKRFAPARVPPLEYRVLERQTGRTVRGVACAHFGPDGCRLEDLKGPLCITYLCDPARSAVAELVGPDLAGADPDDFCGSRQVLLAVVAAGFEAAESEVDRLEARLAGVGRGLINRGMSSGGELYRRWEAACECQLSSAQGSSPMSSTR